MPRRSRFDHAEEVAIPGYYAVDLRDYGIHAELTATPRVAFQRYTFPASEESHILFDIGNRQGESGATVDAEVRLTEEGLVEGVFHAASEVAFQRSEECVFR